MNTIHIDTLDLPGLAPYARLTEAQLLNRLHPGEGLFICESEKVIRVALEHGVEPVSFLCEEKHLECVNALVCKYANEVPVYTGERSLLASLTGYELSRGILCAMHRPKLPTVSDVLSLRPSGEIYKSRLSSDLWITPQAGEKKVRVAVMDSVVNSTNTGAIFRAAAAMGVDALLLTRTCCDPLNRRACRVSMGTVFQIPWTWLDGIKNEELRVKNYPLVLKELGFKTVALALTDHSVAIDDPVLKTPERLAIIMGTEGDGLSDSVLNQCDYVARISMHRGVDSLNVAAAASVAFYELLRVK
ncbi:MAG: TrmH family RNA methyltransferase [bacterium]